MTYELAKRMGDAWFPQLKGIGDWIYDGSYDEPWLRVILPGMEREIADPRCVVVPSLEMILESCPKSVERDGKTFYLDLSCQVTKGHQNLRWYACYEDVDHKYETHLESGKTAREAAGKLFVTMARR